jgi:hypothetical protein
MRRLEKQYLHGRIEDDTSQQVIDSVYRLLKGIDDIEGDVVIPLNACHLGVGVELALSRCDTDPA